VAFGALALTGCATMNVSSHVRSGIDFAQYRTYDWGPADALPTGDPRLDKNLFFQDHVLGAVEKQLAARGFEMATTGTPDLLIHYHASIDRRIDINRPDQEHGYCYEDDCHQPEVRVSEFVSATVVRGYALSPIDAAWQATATTQWALAVDTLLGLEHLNGETVDVVGDGQILAPAVVAGGQITLESPAVVVHVGFAYDCDLETLQVNLAGAESVQGKQKIVRRVDVGIVDARNVRAGVDFDHLEPAKSRYREQWGREPDAKAGLLEYAISASWDEAGKVCIRAGGGLPATVLAVTPHMGVGQ
jgi:hypothetical protein